MRVAQNMMMLLVFFSFINFIKMFSNFYDFYGLHEFLVFSWLYQFMHMLVICISKSLKQAKVIAIMEQ